MAAESSSSDSEVADSWGLGRFFLFDRLGPLLADLVLRCHDFFFVCLVVDDGVSPHDGHNTTRQTKLIYMYIFPEKAPQFGKGSSKAP